MPSNADIQAWLAANPGATDQQIRYAMNQYGVTPQQLAGATGMDPNQVQQRYYAAHYGADDINGWLQRNPGASDATMRQVMDQYGVSPYDVSAATGVNLGQVTSRYDAAAPAGTSQAANVMPAGGVGNTQAGSAPAGGYGAPATTNPLGGVASAPSAQGVGAQGVPGVRYGRPAGAGGYGQGGSAYGQGGGQGGYGGSQNALTRVMYQTNTGMSDQQPNAMVGAVFPGRRAPGMSQ
jgi:uncharacterized protein YneF (UPF0154 family)